MSEGTWYTEYNVKRHDTVSDILRRFDVSIRDIMEYNETCNLFSLREGQTLIIKNKPIKAGRSYVLGEGETLRTVSEKFGVSMPALLKANANYMPHEIRQGIRITLPDKF